MEGEYIHFWAKSQQMLQGPQPLVLRPKLTDQLLQKPPFRFLQDIVSEVTQNTGFAQGSIPTGADAAAAGQSREGKIAYLEKVFAEISEATGRAVPARPSKVVAGLEPENTNIFLQMLAEAAASKMPVKSPQAEQPLSLPPVRPKNQYPAQASRDLPATSQSAAIPEQSSSPDLFIVGAGISASHSLLQEAAPMPLGLPTSSMISEALPETPSPAGQRRRPSSKKTPEQAPQSARQDKFECAATLVMQTAQIAQQLVRCYERCRPPNSVDEATAG
ncbi:hypothetical protein WJX84_008528 [Apatococcus fuscideae]|uniref:TRAF3-interacting protein 1 N-terminal domain-containing protein n=1 Tax=Apatococcus fuscideae TaxID=2026836 RepID=A0AAW1SPE9_9CHLO